MSAAAAASLSVLKEPTRFRGCKPADIFVSFLKTRTAGKPESQLEQNYGSILTFLSEDKLGRRSLTSGFDWSVTVGVQSFDKMMFNLKSSKFLTFINKQ